MDNVLTDKAGGQIQIEAMSERDLELALTWAKGEGWNPGKYDYKSYYAQDPKGFLVLCLNDEPIGCISIVKYSENFAFIGLFIVLPEYRNQGYGKRLWDAAMKHLEQCPSIGLYAVPQQVSNYKKSLFFEYGRNRRWEMPESKKSEAPLPSNLQSAKPNDPTALAKLIKYDQTLWGESREQFLKTAIEQPESYAFITFDKNGKVNGYGVIRPCVQGYRIGPLYSSDPESAKELTYALISQIPKDSSVIFDIPTQNTFSEIFAQYFKLNRVESTDTKTMFKGEIHDGSEEKCYGVASLEIG